MRTNDGGTVSFTLEPDEAAALARLAAKHGISPPEYVRQVVILALRAAAEAARRKRDAG